MAALRRVLAGLSLILLLGCEEDDEPTAPDLDDTWSGTWTITRTTTPCGGGSTQVETFPGVVLRLGWDFQSVFFDDSTGTCYTNFDGSDVDIACTSDTVADSCQGNRVRTFRADRDDDSFTGSEVTAIAWQGPCGHADSCERSTWTGTRTGPAPPVQRSGSGS